MFDVEDYPGHVMTIVENLMIIEKHIGEAEWASPLLQMKYFALKMTFYTDTNALGIILAK